MSLITREGYVIDEGDFEPWHADELTVQAIKNPFFKEEPQPFPVFNCRGDGTVAVPRFWGCDNFGIPKAKFGHVEKSTRLVFNGELRSVVQKIIVEKATTHLRSRGGGILSARTGLGKTVVALCVACAMGLKTMVVVHKQFLMDQWEERIRTFVPLARVGRLQQNIEDVDDCDIVVGMLQSIAMRDYDEYVFQDFGMVIFDEVHVVPAPVFSRALLKLCAPYVLGLSATPERKDGLTRVIHWFVGPIFFEHALSGEDRVTVRVVNFRLNRALPKNTVAAATILCNMSDRNALIVNCVSDLAAAGHKVLLLSDRRAHCENMKMSLMKIGVDAALYLGGMKNYELKKSEGSQVLLGTYALAREGLDIPSLDALVLATPRSDVTQACGRILHGHTDLDPVIVDIVDQWFLGQIQHNKRKGSSSCAPDVMLRYVYSALLLALAKPACDYVIKLINRNTDAKIDDATAEILTQLKKRFDELQREVRELVSESNNGDAQIAEARRLISACNEEISRSRKRLSPAKVRDASDIRQIQKDIADVRQLVLENCTVLDSSDMQKVQDDVACLQKMVETCKEEVIKSRTAAHDDAKSLHNEHVQIYKALKF